jgi:pyrroline-5-carboxylate reductase
MEKVKIAVLGGGNLGTSLAKGLIFSKHFGYDDVIITEKRESRINFLKTLGFKVSSDNRSAAAEARILVMSVKPQHLKALPQKYATSSQTNTYCCPRSQA